MKHVLFLICLLPLGIFAQPGYHGKASLQTDSFRLIELPKLKGEPYFLKEDSVLSKKGFIVNTSKLYYRLFAQYPADSLPFIDFAKYQLKPVSRCIYRHPALEPGDNIEKCRHRQACFYGIDWFLMRRKQ